MKKKTKSRNYKPAAILTICGIPYMSLKDLGKIRTWLIEEIDGVVRDPVLYSRRYRARYLHEEPKKGKP